MQSLCRNSCTVRYLHLRYSSLTNTRTPCFLWRGVLLWTDIEAIARDVLDVFWLGSVFGENSFRSWWWQKGLPAAFRTWGREPLPFRTWGPAGGLGGGSCEAQGIKKINNQKREVENHGQLDGYAELNI